MNGADRGDVPGQAAGFFDWGGIKTDPVDVDSGTVLDIL